MFFALRAETPPPWEYQRALVCERMGWTFVEFDQNPLEDIDGLLAVWDGVARSRPDR